MQIRKLFLTGLAGLLSVTTSMADDQRFIIETTDVAAVKSEAHAQGANISHDLKYVHGFVAHMSHAAAAQIKSRFGSSVIIEEDGEVFASGKPGGSSTPPPQSIPWGITAVKASDAFSKSRGAGVTVCVVDTGIQSNHSDLAANITGGENFVFIKGSVDPAKWTDDNGHGTHVSGTIAAIDNSIGVIGVAPDAKLFAAKVLDRQGSGSLSAVADGVRSCIAHGAQVINMSLGGPSNSTVLHNAIIDAKNAGIVIVVAAGNESSDVSTSYPAAYPEVIAVSAVNSSMSIASFSNYGTGIAFSAPGVGIYSTYKGDSYATLNGTSMASPHVAGVAALMISASSLGLLGHDIGLSPVYQGAGGFIDALLTVNNIPQ